MILARVAILAIAAALLPAGVRAAERWEGLRALPRVAVEVTVSPNHPEVAPDELRRHVEEALHHARLAPAVDAASADRLRLSVAVRAYSSSDLRGYYLPLSQAYGIGPVRLAVERPASIAGLTPIPATVWQVERQAMGPWRSSATEITGLADEVVAVFLADYRRAQGQ